MKYILIGLLLIAAPYAGYSQNKAINKFYRTYKKGSDVQNMKLPGWLIRFGGKIAVKSSDMDEEKEKMSKELIKKAGKVRFIYSEDGANVPQKAIQKLRNDLHEFNFEDLIMIRSGEMDFQLMIKEKDGLVENLTMLYNNTEDGEMVFLSMKMKLRLEDLNQLIEKEMEEKYHKFMEPEEEIPVAEPVL